MSIVHAYSNPVADGTATSVVRPRDWNSAHVQAMTLSGNVAGQSSFSANNIVMQGGPNVTLSGIVAGALATLLVSAASPAPAMSFANSNGIVFGTSNGQVTASYTVPNTFAQTQQPLAYAAGGTTKTGNTLGFLDGNGVSFSTGAGGVRASVRTDYAASNITTNNIPLASSTVFQATSATSVITSAAMPLANGSLYQQTTGNSLFQYRSNTSAITSNAIHLSQSSLFTGGGGGGTGYIATSQSSLFQHTTATSAITANAIHVSNSTLFTGGGGAGSGAGISAGTQSVASGMVVFANSNNITFGMSGNSRITASVNAAATTHNHGPAYLYLTNLSGTINSASSALSISLSAAVGGGGGGGGGAALSIGTNSRNSGTIVFSNSNGVTFGMDTDGNVTMHPGGIRSFMAGASTVTIGSVYFPNSYGFTWSLSNGQMFATCVPPNSNIQGVSAGTSAVYAGNVVFANSNGVSFGLNGSTVTASVAAGGGANQTCLIPVMPGSLAQQTFGAMGQSTGSIFFMPLSVSAAVNFNAIQVPVSASFVTSAAAASQTLTSLFGIYSLNVNSMAIVSSSSIVIRASVSGGSATVNAPYLTSASGYDTQDMNLTGSAQCQSYFGTVGIKKVDMVFGNTMSLSAGVYYLGVLVRQSSVGGNAGVSVGMVGNAAPNVNNISPMGGATADLTGDINIRAPFQYWGIATNTIGNGGTVLTNNVFIGQLRFGGPSVSVLPLLTLISRTF